jgi:lipopolysaccharide export system protein LptA
MKNNTLGAFTDRLEMDTHMKVLTSTQSDTARSTYMYRLMRCDVSCRYIVCALIMFAFTLCTGNHACHAQTGKQLYGISVAVLPFEVFSIAKEPTLGSEVADLIGKQLTLNPSIVCVDNQQIKTVMQPDDYANMSADRLRQLAKLLNANCIIMGTITKIRNEHSIDVEMFNTSASGPNYKTYAEGLEIKSLVETITTAIDQEIVEKAERIPATERPKISAGRQQSPQTPAGGFDVERELLAAFGPMKQEPPKPAGASSTPTEDRKQPATAPTAENLADETATAALKDSMQSTPEPEAPIAAQDGKKGGQATKDSKKRIDSDFFSLSKAISINADSMEYDNRSNMAIFKGNVVARQDDIVMFANAMHVYYSEGGGLSRVDAQGNVRVVQGDRIATGSSIVFNNATQTIVATGDPRVWQGDNVVHGKKITVYLKEERTVVEGEPNSRASATIYPDSDKKKP